MLDSLWFVDVTYMIAFNPTYANTSGHSRERSERIIRKRHGFAITVQKCRPRLNVFLISNGQEKRWLHVDSPVQSKNLYNTIMYDAVQGSMLRNLAAVVEESVSWFRLLLK